MPFRQLWQLNTSIKRRFRRKQLQFSVAVLLVFFIYAFRVYSHGERLPVFRDVSAIKDYVGVLTEAEAAYYKKYGRFGDLSELQSERPWYSFPRQLTAWRGFNARIERTEMGYEIHLWPYRDGLKLNNCFRATEAEKISLESCNAAIGRS